MNGLCLFLCLLFLGMGCSQQPDEAQPLSPSSGESPVSLEGPGYQNSRFGYQVQLPPQMTAYALTQEQTAVVAEQDDELVFLVDGETNFFTIRGMDDPRTPHEWLTDNLSFFYPTGEAAQRVGEVAGEQALFLYGEGTGDSPARVAVFRFNGHLMVISYEQENQAFESVLETFTAL